MRYLLLSVLVAAIGFVLYVRLAQSQAERWHIDPLTASDPGRAGVLHLPGSEAPIYPLAPDALLARFDQIARAAPRVTVLAGSVAAGHITYIARSRVMGFPDYISVKAVPAEGGAQLAIYARLRFGAADLGVNAARIQTWLTALNGA